MLKLFQTIFGGGEQQGRYPESLIAAAIERAVDGTDSRLRALFGYKKSLRPSVIHAIDHAVALVDAIPAPLPAGRRDYNADPRLKALFASAERMQEVFGNDVALNEFRGGSGNGAERVVALLLAERVEKNVLGMELAGDMLRRDVAQVSVSFRNDRLIEVTTNEADTRRQLKRRAFDHLLTLALARMADMHGERADLARQRDLLRHKLSVLKRGGWSFEATGGAPPEHAALLAELQDIETALKKLGTDSGALQQRLDIVADVLGHAEQQLWAEDFVIHLDNMNIRRDARDVPAQRISLQELHNARGASLALLLVSLAPGELPRREHFISAAERSL
ncbi:MAG: hypothetical protein WA635_12850 [Gallionella sp.]